MFFSCFLLFITFSRNRAVCLLWSRRECNGWNRIFWYHLTFFFVLSSRVVSSLFSHTVYILQNRTYLVYHHDYRFHWIFYVEFSLGFLLVQFSVNYLFILFLFFYLAPPCTSKCLVNRAYSSCQRFRYSKKEWYPIHSITKHLYLPWMFENFIEMHSYVHLPPPTRVLMTNPMGGSVHLVF